MTGHVKTINREKGYGFIKGENGVDYFFHRSALKNAKIEALGIGERVEFDDEDNTKGPRAQDVYV